MKAQTSLAILGILMCPVLSLAQQKEAWTAGVVKDLLYQNIGVQNVPVFVIEARDMTYEVVQDSGGGICVAILRSELVVGQPFPVEFQLNTVWIEGPWVQMTLRFNSAVKHSQDRRKSQECEMRMQVRRRVASKTSQP